MASKEGVWVGNYAPALAGVATSKTAIAIAIAMSRTASVAELQRELGRNRIGLLLPPLRVDRGSKQSMWCNKGSGCLELDLVLWLTLPREFFFKKGERGGEGGKEEGER